MNIENINPKEGQNQGGLIGKSKSMDGVDKGLFNKSLHIEKVKSEAAIMSAGLPNADPGTYSDAFERPDEEKLLENFPKPQDATLSSASNKMTEDDYQNLEKEGVSLDSFNAERLERALQRMKENRDFKQEYVDISVEKKQEMQETIEKISIANKISDPIAKKLAVKLMEAGLPVTEDNVMKLFNAMGMTAAAASMTEGSMAYMIDQELPPTVENIYHSKYSGFQAGAVNEAGWDAIKEMVGATLEKAGLPNTPENLEKAKWLYANHLPITAESIESYNGLTDIKENANEDYVLDKMAESMRKGYSPEAANLDEGPQKRVEKAIEEIYKYDASKFHSLDEVTAKRQLEEIRLKLTIESGAKLYRMGIKIDTTNLQRVVEGLKEIENDYYRGIIRESGEIPTDYSTQLLKETTVKMQELSEAPSYVLGSTLDQVEMHTVDKLHEAATNMRRTLERAGEVYESVMTKPRQDLGDSINKAFRNIPEILTNMNVETTVANERAARILAYNRMPITPESIQSIKEYDSQVNVLVKELHPAVTVELLKRNINPLELPIEELTQKVKEIKQEIGVTDQEKFSKFLWKLERSASITPEERNDYIGIYRLLNDVEKTNGAAIGAVMNNGVELTLKNLSTAAKTAAVPTIDIGVDDSFGGINNPADGEGHITLERDSGYVVYQSQVLGRVMDSITPGKMQQINKDKDVNNLMNMTLESMEDQLQEVTEDPESDRQYATQMAEKIRGVAGSSQAAEAFLNTHHLATSLKFIEAAKEYYVGTKSIFKEIEEYADNEYNQLIESISESMTDAQTMQTLYRRIDSRVNVLLYRMEYGDQPVTQAKVDSFRKISGGIELAKRLSRQEHYEIPVDMGEEITNMSLTVLQGAGDTGRVQMSINSESMGRIEGELAVRDRTINGFILCDTKDGLDTMKGCKEQLKGMLSGLGLNVAQFTVGMDKKALQNFQKQGKEPSGEVGTPLLYQVAKTMVKTIGAAMRHE